MIVNAKKVVLKSLNKLRPFARFLGGDMSESVHYFVKFNGEVMKREEDPDCSFVARGFHVLEHGEEFLVVDHPNPISKRDYEAIKELFDEKEDKRSMKGVC